MKPKGGSAQWRYPVRCREAARGAGAPKPVAGRNGSMRLPADSETSMGGDARAGGSIRPHKDGRRWTAVTARHAFPPSIRQFVEFYQALRGRYLIFERLH
ncbi:hypothetical protein ACGTRS_05470 [Burkholderia semiarida]|uniref:Uncharacterized protein n=1 Tax=Burkholderia semiarida TaxID=2843303 RepID=A0ABW7KXX8_9BURK